MYTFCTITTHFIHLSIMSLGPSWLWSYGSWIYNYLCNQCLLPLILWVLISIRMRCITLCDKVCQWLATGRWFSPVSSTNKTDHHDITEILLKVALNTTCLLYSIFPAISYPLWYIHRQGNRAIVSPCVKSSKHITHSPLSSCKTSSVTINN
jgi:hypothetical protein